MIASQDRREFKFLLQTRQSQEFRGFVADKIPIDRGAESGYLVYSTYYDTPDRHSYWQKQWGSCNRRRVRARVYGFENDGAPPAAFIEIKHKQDSDSVKRRASLPIVELEQLASGEIPPSLLQAGRSQADKNLVEELKDLVVAEAARPVLQVCYHRMAYDYGNKGTIRITFDSSLRCRLNLKPLALDDQDFPMPIVSQDMSVIEVKTIGPVPLWLRHAAGRFNLSPISMSKYCNALERFDPCVARSPFGS
ncbi:MAG: polyphosphate polymerase domain-containing protein [Verrucomicrobia bacterium]|nr:MAG: polyphosphate polymerase domain-containing protein [Verrucomicrobiota bacterium]